MRPITTTKLSDDDVMDILNDDRRTVLIAAQYGVGCELIQAIRRGSARRPVYDKWMETRQREAAE